MFDSSVFEERLRDLMLEAEVNASQLANEILISKVSVGRYLNEKRTPEIRILIKLADYFKVTTDFLIGLEDENTRDSFLQCPPFPERFDYLIKSKNETKYRIEKVTHISENSIYSWLKGENTPSLENIIRLAKFFECSVDELLGRAKYGN